ncbi:MAG: hypothetical protein ACW99G_22975 [Candidatus Thorarchaeota archaeon]|jgi:hypothetical protein
MKSLLQALIAFLLLGSITFAQSPSYPRDAILCWTHPTLYEDGTTIQDGDLAHTRVTGIRHSGETVVDQNIPMVGLPGAQQCQTLVGVIPQPGTYTFVAYSVTVDDISSDPSNTAAKKYTGKPNPPEGLGVQ